MSENPIKTGEAPVIIDTAAPHYNSVARANWLRGPGRVPIGAMLQYNQAGSMAPDCRAGIPA
ncbi:MAG: hypothetical protein CML06_03685 [Pseudomonadales bacterium]|nr:hypothetical protein [Pseudomonadales bacterium]